MLANRKLDGGGASHRAIYSLYYRDTSRKKGTPIVNNFHLTVNKLNRETLFSCLQAISEPDIHVRRFKHICTRTLNIYQFFYIQF